MSLVHVFISAGRFRSFDEIGDFIDPQYDVDGDMIPSAFMAEVGFDEYEPDCIEAHHEGRIAPLGDFLRGFSDADRWIDGVDVKLQADAVICVYDPNVILRPEKAH